MSIYVGKTNKDVHKIKGNKDGQQNIDYKAVYGNINRIWPDLILKTIPDSVKFESKISPSYNSVIDPNTLNIDIKSEGTITFIVETHETSEWHRIPFILQVPEGVKLIKVTEVNKSGVEVNTLGTEFYPNNVEGTEYGVSNYTIFADYPEIQTLDTNIKITLEIGPNTSPATIERKIVITHYYDMFDNLYNCDLLVCQYSQAVSFMYDTYCAFVNKPELGDTKLTINTDSIQISADTNEVELYLAIVFAMSTNGGQSWTYGPPNDHMNGTNIDPNSGNLLSDAQIKECLSISTEHLANVRTEVIGLYSTEPENIGNYVVKIRIYNIPNNDDSNERIQYDWRTTDSTIANWDPSTLAPGGGRSSRKIAGINRIKSTTSRQFTIGISFMYIDNIHNISHIIQS